MYTFTDNKIDLAISATYPDGIYWEQGSFVNGIGTVGTGNIWTSSSYSGLYKNISNSGHWLTFYDAGTAPSTISWNNTSSTPSGINIIPVTYNRGCDSRIGGTVAQLSSSAKSSLYATKASLLSNIAGLEDAYTALIDEGNTNDLLAELPTLPAIDAHTRLMSISPYVSETVLRYAVDNSIMSEELLTEVIQANPDVLRAVGLPYLENANFAIEDFNEAITAVTDRTDKQTEIATAKDNLSEAYRLLFADLKNDFEYEYLYEITELLSEQGALESAYELAGYYYSIGNTTSGAATLNGIPDVFDLTTEQENIHEAYVDIRGILEGIKANQQTSLTDAQVITLTGIEENFAETYIGQVATTMLNQYNVAVRTLCTPPILYPAMRLTRSQPKVKPASKDISVYPNPAKDHVVFSYDLKNTNNNLKLTITDISGKALKEYTLPKSKGVQHWYTNDIPNDVYLYKISDSKKNYGNGKVVIVK